MKSVIHTEYIVNKSKSNCEQRMAPIGRISERVYIVRRTRICDDWFLRLLGRLYDIKSPIGKKVIIYPLRNLYFDGINIICLRPIFHQLIT